MFPGHRLSASSCVRHGWPLCGISGRGAAWLARLLGVQEVPSSNLGGPTKTLIDLQTLDLPKASVWSPIGVQNGRRLGAQPPIRGACCFPRRAKYPPGGHAYVLRVKSLGLSPLIRTRQTRHFGDKPLIPQGRSMSGSPQNPTWNPTKPSQKPDNQPPAGRRRYTLLTILTLLRMAKPRRSDALVSLPMLQVPSQRDAPSHRAGGIIMP